MPNPTLLVAPVNALPNFPAVGAGSNRIAVVEVLYARTNAGNITTPTAMTVNGVAGTYFSGDAPGSTQDRASLTGWYFEESQISSIAGGAVVITGGAFGTIARANGYVVQDTKQGSVLNQAMARVSTGGLSIPLTRVADSYTVFAGFVEINESVTITNPAWVTLISNVNFAYAADTARTANTTTQSKSYRQTGHVVNFEPAPAQAITNVNGGAGIKIGSTGNTAPVTGAPSAATGGTIGGKAITVTDWDSDTGVATFTAPDIVNGESFPDINSNQTFVITGSGWSASLSNVPLAPPTGSTAVTVASPDNVDDHKLGVHIIDALGITPANGWKFYGYNPRKVSDPGQVAAITWLPDTGYKDAEAPLTTGVALWDAGTGLAYLLNVTIPTDGAIVVPPIDVPATELITVAARRKVNHAMTGTYRADLGGIIEDLQRDIIIMKGKLDVLES